MSDTVLVALSGGIDSSMSALYLKEAGYKPRGVYFQVHDIKERHQKSISNVEKVSKFLGIPYEIVDLREVFRERVYERFLSDYKAALTPNPCTVCNKEIKFGELLKIADRLECEFLASGHYVRSDKEFIYKGIDPSKDQSYFLFNIDRAALKRAIFPLGDKLKESVKKEALAYEVFQEIAQERESSEICFVEKDYTEILKNRFECDIEGAVVDEEGKTVGTHKGYMHYTIGKRRGFLVPSSQEPLYVKYIDAEKNQITVAKKEALFSSYLEAKELNMFLDSSFFECQTKIRYNGGAIDSSVIIDKGLAKISLKESAFAIAKGQAAVFYDGDKLLGGGFII